jgi:hypothetical protein
VTAIEEPSSLGWMHETEIATFSFSELMQKAKPYGKKTESLFVNCLDRKDGQFSYQSQTTMVQLLSGGIHAMGTQISMPSEST